MQKSDLSLINFYKILRIDNFASQAEIRRAYLRMAKEYHPDVNQDQEAEEIFKLVNKAHSTLSNPARKKLYDQRLKYGYVLEGIQIVRNSKEERIKRAMARKEEMAKKSRAKEIHKYEHSLERFPLFARYGIYGMVLIYGMFLWFNNWIVNFANYSMYALMLGITLSMVGTVTLIDTNYKRMRIRQFRRGRINEHEKKSVWIFVVMLVLVPIVVIQLSNFRKRYHLEHYPEYVLAKVDSKSMFGGKAEYKYKVNDRTYLKYTDEVEMVYGVDGEYWMIVRYSKRKPVISEPVDFVKHGKDLFEKYGW